ncbi:twitching motility protein PilT [Aphanothece hegewaldii CCALA 016]|uniref:Twitching motility protein PilT n=1 Tax=Aphanothece hegewaldii CCALA 016 TaxID=2107694 RepID=A0A2T1LW72_9CHRO|nr:type II toxin-antitoxin system VapC family toxin [Aphanothece hegewaldii]PSF36151.1 twitching motility protein PilT [Aphanothece hegewaldii CCALA 016]
MKEVYLVDTHALVWFMTENSRLPPKAKQILSQAETGGVEILISTIVLAELTYIIKRKNIPISIDEVLNRINKGSGFNIVPFDLEVFQILLTLPDTWEIHDRIIAATANYYKAILITKDGVLKNSNLLKVVWD